MNKLDDGDSEMPAWMKGALIALVIFTASSFLFPYLFTQFGLINIGAKSSADVGSIIGGILSPFISIVAAFLTFLAFYVQYQANQNQREEFRIQSQDAIFFRLFDDLHSKIVSTFVGSGTPVSGYNVLSKLVQEYGKLQDAAVTILGRQLLVENHTLATSLFFHKLYSNEIWSWEYAEKREEEFHKEMSKLTDKSDRWEFIKGFVGSSGFEGTAEKDALSSFARVNFYRIDFKTRYETYQSTLQRFISSNSEFLDSYYKSWEFIATFIVSSKNKLLYISYYKSKCSKFDLLLLFYYLSGGQASDEFYRFNKEYDLLGELANYGSNIIDAPAPYEIHSELQNIYDIPNFTYKNAFNIRYFEEEIIH